VEHGAALYASTCAACHGADGRKIIFHSDGLDESLAAVAGRDPFRFLHRTCFGVAGTEMPIGYDLGWSAADGRDMLAHAQTLPGVEQTSTGQPASARSEPAPRTIVGPSDNPLLGIFTAVLAAFGMIGTSILLLAVFVFIGVLVVFALPSGDVFFECLEDICKTSF
jgi:hypothetical protein